MDDLAKHLITHITIMPDDQDGDGLSGYNNLEVYSDKSHTVSALVMEKRCNILMPEVLSQCWTIGLTAAKNTLKETTQASIRNFFAPGKCKVHQCLDHLWFSTLQKPFYTDTMFSVMKSICGYKAAQVFMDGAGYDWFYPMVKKTDMKLALTSFI